MRALMIVKYVLAGLVGLVGLAVAGVYARSEFVVRRTYAQPLLDSVPVHLDSADLAEGERLARIRGCYGGCHGSTLEGSVFFNVPRVATVPAPNLTRVVREYSDAELERVIRRGVKRDGRSVFGMPSDMFAELSDVDLGRIIAFLRSQPVLDFDPGVLRLGPLGRLGMALGMYPPIAPMISASPPATTPAGDPLELGRYIVRTTCTECHGQDLRGDQSGTPPLSIAVAFTPEDWTRLIREGKGLGGREIGLMGEVALSRLNYLTNEEASAVHLYLRTSVESNLQ